MFLPPQPPQVFLRRLLAAVDQVAKDIDGILPCNLVVSVFDEGFVHLLNAGEGPVAKPDAVLVTEMQVRGKENHGDSPSFFNRGTGISCHRQ